MEAPLEHDPIPLEDLHKTVGPDADGMAMHRFCAFNTVVTLQAYADFPQCSAAFEAARAKCRIYERRLSRTLPHSDIARLNAAAGRRVRIDPETAELLQAARSYCADSEGRFDITMGSVVALWDFRHGVMPARDAVRRALSHVDWRMLHVEEDGGRAHAWLDDPGASVDAGGIAKGWIADRLAALLAGCGIESFVVNLGGNVVTRGRKPGGAPWRIGLQDPRSRSAVVSTVLLDDASAVTSGVYERCFRRGEALYHHILDPQTGFPVRTDALGATVVARSSLVAEGYSTTILSLGIERGIAFARSHPAIVAAYLVDAGNTVHRA